MTAASFVAELELAKRTRVLHFSRRNVEEIPAAILECTELQRLDLSNNFIQRLPDEIGNLTALEELWLNGNPLLELPDALQNCRKLRVLDLRGTRVARIPKPVSRLPALIEMDLRDTVLKPRYRANYKGGTGKLVTHLKYRDRRRQLKDDMERTLMYHVYKEIGDTPQGKEQICAVVKRLFQVFMDFADIRAVIRNAERLFPENIDDIDARTMLAQFVQVKRDIERQKLAAEVTIKLRAFYYNRIDPSRVENVVQDIYNHVPRLEDIKFLIHFCTRLFAEELDSISGEAIMQAIIDLRKQFAEERKAAFDMLQKALNTHYADKEPHQVERLAKATATLFKKVEDLKRLAADVSVYFPAEYGSAKPRRIFRAYQEAQAEVGI